MTPYATTMRITSTCKPTGYSGTVLRIVVVAKTVTVTVTLGAGLIVSPKLLWLGLLFESPGYEAVTDAGPGVVPVSKTEQLAPDSVQTLAAKYRLTPDHETLSPEILTNAPVIVTVQELVDPTSNVMGEHATEVLVDAGVLTVTELSAF
jgi:hypothetical protein